MSWILILLSCALVLSGCQIARGLTNGVAIRPAAATSELSGKVLVWHARTGRDAEVLESILRDFEALHPGLELLITQVDAETMPERFMNAAYSGLGPDLFIGPNSWINMLARNRMILSLPEVTARSAHAGVTGESSHALVERMSSRYSTAILNTVTHNDQVYGVPESLNVEALYYNRQRVATPPQTLDELLALVSAGNGVAISTAFTDAFWGVSAFGGRLLDEEGRVVLNEGGFANWLNWLENARDVPGTLLDADRLDLQERFRRGEVAFYVGYASEYGDIVQLPEAAANEEEADTADGDAEETTQKLPEQDVGVALLPGGPAGNAAPFLTSQAYFFNAASSAHQLRLALSIVDFATNAENSTRLMRDAHRVPANVNVRVNPRLDPNMFSFTSQSRMSVASPLMSATADWAMQGTSIYRQVLEGILSPAQAADQLTQTLDDVTGFAVTDAPASDCTRVGVVTLWDAAGEPLDAALDSTLRAFAAACPNMIVQRQTVSEEELRSAWVQSRGGNAGQADLLLAPHAWLGELVSANAVADITALVGVEVLQRYSPAALNAMRMEGKLYGLPYSMDVPALYYNREMVDVPINTLSDLLNFSNASTQVAFPLDFERAYWGVAAFGGRQPNGSAPGGNGGNAAQPDAEFVIDVAAFLEWLTWLRSAQANVDVWLTPDSAAAQSRFVSGEAAYYVGVASDLHGLRQAMGADAVGVVDLPTGAESNVRVLLEAQGFVFNAAASPAQRELAAQFALFATSAAGQNTLVEQTDRVPANVTVEVGSDDPINAFVDQAAYADVAPSVELAAAIERATENAFASLLSDDVAPSIIVQQMVQDVVSSAGREMTLDELTAQESMRLEELGLVLVNLDALVPDAEEPENAE